MILLIQSLDSSNSLTRPTWLPALAARRADATHGQFAPLHLVAVLEPNARLYIRRRHIFKAAADAADEMMVRHQVHLVTRHGGVEANFLNQPGLAQRAQSVIN
ncbi:MAG: hypothetical protein M3371_11615, partial [Acidobacteriota bacterium]|nr:hypothetical protein [Acidobacteriota bacterium]